ncbi:von Willebrand factor [Aphelenchoides avenae]|nr:von Willebrand factor [Aphelenchus avenae]
MLSGLIFLWLLCPLRAAVVTQKDCGCDPPGPTLPPPCNCVKNQTWIDVIVVVDTSASMGLYGLSNAVGTLSSVFGDLTIGQGMKYQTRVGLVSYDAQATLIANLTTYSKFEELDDGLQSIKQSSNDEVNLLDALKLVGEIMERANQSKTRQTVVLVVASAYTGTGATDPWPIATQMRESGIKILALAMAQIGEAKPYVSKICELAWSHDFCIEVDTAHLADILNLADNIETKFCDANCFCPTNWNQVTDNFTKPKTKYAECVRLSSVPSNWHNADQSCQRWANDLAYLASEKSPLKHQFHQDYVRSIYGSVVPYLIGLNYRTEAYFWEWRNATDEVWMTEMNPNGYQAWYNGVENHALGSAVQVAARGFETYWFNVRKAE